MKKGLGNLDNAASLATASDAIVEIKIRGADSSELVSYADNASPQNKDFDEKAEFSLKHAKIYCALEWNACVQTNQVNRMILGLQMSL